MDEADELYPEGYELGDFMVLYEVFSRVSDSEPLKPWSGGVRSGLNSPVVAFSSTPAYWLAEAWLVEALTRVRDERRREMGEHQEAGADDGDD